MGITNGVLLMLEMRQLVIKYMACTDVSTTIGIRIPLEQLLLCVEGVQNNALFSS